MSNSLLGALPHAALDDLEVLLGRVQDGDALAVEDLGERRDVDGQRVDEGDAALPGELEQGEMGKVGPLPVELGVEPVDLAVRELLHKCRETTRVADPAVVADTGGAAHDRALAAGRAADEGGPEGFGARAVASLQTPEARARGPAVAVPHLIVSVLRLLMP